MTPMCKIYWIYGSLEIAFHNTRNKCGNFEVRNVNRHLSHLRDIRADHVEYGAPNANAMLVKRRKKKTKALN